MEMFGEVNGALFIPVWLPYIPFTWWRGKRLLFPEINGTETELSSL